MRTITGTIHEEGGDPWADAPVLFELLTNLAVNTAATVDKKSETGITDESGNFSVELETPEENEGSWRYQCTLPSGQRFTFLLGPGDTISISSIIENEGLAGNECPDVGTGGGGDFPEAPEDGKQYGRQSKTWTLIDVLEAAKDGKPRGRQDGTWVLVDEAGSAQTVQGNLDTHEGDATNPHSVTAAQVGADESGSAAIVAGALSDHEALSTTAHGGIVADSDSRLTDARTPTDHAASHATGEDDAIAAADIGAEPTITGGTSTQVWNGVKAWVTGVWLNVAQTWTAVQTFSAGIVTPWVAPAADGAEAFQIVKADKTTPILKVDTTNGQLGINSANVSYPLDVYGANVASRGYFNVDNLHPAIGCWDSNSDVKFQFKIWSGQYGMVGTQSDHDMYLIVNSTRYLRINTSGLVFIGGNTNPTATADIAAGTTAAASLRIRDGVAPTSPNDGDIWQDGTDLLIRIGGTTYGLIQDPSALVAAHAAAIYSEAHPLPAVPNYTDAGINAAMQALADAGIITYGWQYIFNDQTTHDLTGIAGDSVWYPEVIDRQPGQVVLFDTTITDVAQTIEFGFDTDEAGSIDANALRITGGDLKPVDSGAAGPDIAYPASGTPYQLAVILRAAGAFYMSGDTLLSIHGADASTPVYAGFANTSAAGTVDGVRAPVDLWAPTPIAADTGTSADVAGTYYTDGGDITEPIEQGGDGEAWNGDTWSNGVSGAKNTPGLGAELIPNGDFSAWTGDNPDNWTVSNEDANNYVTENAGGAQWVTDDSTGLYMVQSISGLSLSKFYALSLDVSGASGPGIRFRVNTAIGYLSSYKEYTTGLDATVRLSSTPANMQFIRTGLGAENMIIGGLSFTEIPTADLFRSIETGTTPFIYTEVEGTLGDNVQAGSVLMLDDKDDPQNFVIVYHDDTSVIADKCVDGVYSNLFTIGAAEVPGILPTATTRDNDDGTAQLWVWYDGALIAEQEIDLIELVGVAIDAGANGLNAKRVNVDGTTWNGTDSAVNFHSAGMESFWNPDEGTFLCHATPPADNVARQLFSVGYGTGNNIQIEQEISNEIRMYRNAGGHIETSSAGTGVNTPSVIGCEWSVLNDHAGIIVDGVEIDTQADIRAVVTSTPTENQWAIGAGYGDGSAESWLGDIRDVVISNVEQPMVNVAAVSQKIAGQTLTAEFLDQEFGTGSWVWYSMADTAGTNYGEFSTSDTNRITNFTAYNTGGHEIPGA